MRFAWLDNEQLEKEVTYLRDRAYDAKEQNYAARARDWEVAHDELVRRKRDAQSRP